MKKGLTTVEFHGTKEQEAKLLAVIAELKDVPGSMMPILQQAQDIYGYLPIEVQQIIARETGVSLEEIYGITTFYSQFKLNPNGKYAIAVCLGTACYVKGAQELIDAISKELGIAAGETSSDGKYSLEATRCIGACGLAPVLSINGDVYGRLTAKDIPGILAKYKD
nr:NAD(P)H-dependent oxidoreductase subunit E [Oscillospiraceae bacterium]